MSDKITKEVAEQRTDGADLALVLSDPVRAYRYLRSSNQEFQPYSLDVILTKEIVT